MLFRKKNNAGIADERLGRLLAEAAGSAVAEGPCPSPEQLAALMDGELSGVERDLVLSHLTGCDDCRELLQTAVKISVDGRAAEPQPLARRYVMLVPYAAAAVLLLAVISVALIYRHGPVGYKAQELAQNYVREDVSKQAAQAEPESPETIMPEEQSSGAEDRLLGYASDEDARSATKELMPMANAPLTRKKADTGAAKEGIEAPAAPKRQEKILADESTVLKGADAVVMPMSDMPEPGSRRAEAESFSAAETPSVEQEPAAPANTAAPQESLDSKGYAHTDMPKPRLAEPRGLIADAFEAAPAAKRAEAPAMLKAEARPAPACPPAAEGGTGVCILPDETEIAAAGEAPPAATPEAAPAERIVTAKPSGEGVLVKEIGTIKSIDAEKGEIEFVPQGEKEAIKILVDKELLRGLKPGDRVMAQYEKGTLNVARRIKKARAIGPAVGC